MASNTIREISQPLVITEATASGVRLWLPSEEGGVTDGATHLSAFDLPAGPAILDRETGRLIRVRGYEYDGPVLPGPLQLPRRDGSMYNFNLPRAGLYSVLSAAGGGKSLLARHLANAAGVSVVRVGEPDVGATDGSVADLARAINAAFDEYPGRVVVVDSLIPLSFVPGSAATGGVSRLVFQAIAAIDRFARIRGKAIIAVVNFFAPHDIVQKAYDSVKGSSAGVWEVESVDSHETRKGHYLATQVSWSVRPTRRADRTVLQLNV